MKSFLVFVCISSTMFITYGDMNPSVNFELPIFFHNDRPLEADSYLCTSVSLKNITSYSPSESSLYIEAFTPVAEMSVVHHMLLYGCRVPGRASDRIWNCGNMLGHIDNLPQDGICSGGIPRILYAWARNAPRLVLPKNVSFQVGGNTEIQSIFLQYHTGRGDHGGQHEVMGPGRGSESRKKMNDYLVDVGVILHVSSVPTPKLAGVYLLGSSGAIPPHKAVNLESACLFKENKQLHPFAFRTHSHSLGKVISGYRVRRTSSLSAIPRFEWKLIGKKNPQLPQMFYPVDSDELGVRKGDILAARCTMESNRTRTTYIGPTAADEMCNFYIMYYVTDGKTMENGECYNSGPYTEDFWRKGPLRLNNFPTEAPVLLR